MEFFFHKFHSLDDFYDFIADQKNGRKSTARMSKNCQAGGENESGMTRRCCYFFRVDVKK